MADFKFNPDLFLEVAELERFKKFLDTDGFRKNILENTVKFGLVKNPRVLAFTNARVERDLDTIDGFKTLKVSEIKAINNEGLFIYSSGLNSVVIPADGSWYWLKIKHQYTSQEVGTVSLAINGDVTGTGTKFTEILRGMPNFPSRIKFNNSSFNTLEYDVLEVIDDAHMIVAHPASSGTGVATFNLEENLTYSVVGTFTPGIAIPTNNKFPFQYDSVSYELVKETINNTRPSYSEGQDFLIARVKISGSEVLIQDKRTEFWETKGSHSSIELDITTNPLIGIESVKWQNLLSPSDKNEVNVAWGMRSSNWSINSAQNILTLSSSLGGRFKATSDFTNGDFDEWRAYTSNGNYSRIISSVKQGQAINLTLDTLDIDNYSNDGGLSFNTTEYVLVVPDCEEVELLFQANSTDSQENVNQSFSFPVNTLIARCDLEVYKNPSCLYNVQYRCRTNKNYTEFALIPDDSVGYYTEASFNDNGTLKDVLDRVLYPYAGSLTTGFIQLTLSPNSYSKFKAKAYIGDVVGVNTVGSLDGSSVYNLEVSSNEKYQLFSNNITLVNNLYISLSDTGAIEGNNFKLHFKGVITLGVYKIFIVRDYLTGTPITIKTLEARDVVEVNNRLDGIVIDVYFSDQGKWDTFYQNYDYVASTDSANVKKTGSQTIAGVKTFSDSPIVPSPTTDMQAVPKKYVDDNMPKGAIIMWGSTAIPDNYRLCNGQAAVNGITIPDLSGKFIVGYTDQNQDYDTIGKNGGVEAVTLTATQSGLPSHSHRMFANAEVTAGVSLASQPNSTPAVMGTRGTDHSYEILASDGASLGVTSSTTQETASASHENRPPYYVLAYIIKVY